MFLTSQHRSSPMWNITLPNGVLEKLRCSFCKEFLSQLPVYSYPNQEGAACGRCPVLTDQNPIRDTSYETIAEIVHFPCRYHPYGCLETLNPSSVQHHEEACNYQQYFCPFIPLAACPWQGPSNELFSHYEDHHEGLALLEPTFEIDLINMYENNYLLIKSDQLFVIHVICDVVEQTFSCALQLIGGKTLTNKYLYEITLSKHNGKEKIVLPKKPVDSDGTMSFNKEVAVCIATKEITEGLNNPCSIICTINIELEESKNGSENGLSTSRKIILENDDEEILRELECPICNNYMAAPIFQCVSGHSICGSCKSRVVDCPTCKNKIQSTRNFSLEKMTLLIKYPCKFREFGCKYMLNSDEINKHEICCKFGPHDCPIANCNWKGKITDVMEHAKKEHPENVLDVEYVTWPFVEEFLGNETDFFLISAYGEVFRLIFKITEQNNFFWSVQLVGPREEAAKYMYELDIVDNTNSNQRFFIRRICVAYSKYTDAFNTNISQFLKIPRDLFDPHLNNGDLVYRCRIVQK